MRSFFASVLLVCLSVSILGCGSSAETEMPENPDPMPTEDPLTHEAKEATVD
jgi:hypothetical protein